MDTLTKSKSGFKAILLAKNEDRKINRINDHKATALKLKEDLLMGGFLKAMAMIRPDFQFPKADDTFNLKSMGKDPAPVQEALKSVPAWYSKVHYQVKDGRVELAEGLIDLVDHECSTYTQNDKQNELYEIASGVCDNLNKAHKAGFIGRLDTGGIERSVTMVRWNAASQSFFPNPQHIRQIGADGGIKSMY